MLRRSLALPPLLVALLAGADASVTRPALEAGQSVEIALERTSELRFELEIGGESIEGFELASESRRTKRVERADDEDALLVRYDEVEELVRGPDGEHEIELDLEGLAARLERADGAWSARSQEGRGLGREVEELVLREELAPEGELCALDWLVEDLRAPELARGEEAPVDAALLLWLVGDAEGLFERGEGRLRVVGREELDGEPALLLALEGRVEGRTEDEVEFGLDLEGRLWLEPATSRPLRIELGGPVAATGAAEGPAGVALAGDGRFELLLSFAWSR